MESVVQAVQKVQFLFRQAQAVTDAETFEKGRRKFREIGLFRFSQGKEVVETALVEGNHIGPVKNLVGEMVGGFVHIHCACEKHIPADGDFRRIGVAVVELAPKGGVVQADDRIFFLFQHRNELGEIVLRPGQVHFIEADEEHILRMAGCVDEKLGETCVGAAVHHVLHIHIAKDVTVIHPGRPYRQEAHMILQQPQRPAVETDQPRFAGAAHACQNGEAG